MNNQLLVDLNNRYPDIKPCLQALEEAYRSLVVCFEQGGKLLVCGNGGSAADSEHIVGELMKGFQSQRTLRPEQQEAFTSRFPEQGPYLAANLQGALPCIALTSNSALNTAFANDVAADMAFAQQVFGYGRPGDCLLGISTSGNAQNVLYAMQVAKVCGMTAIGFTGRTGGAMASICDVLVAVPEIATARVQERHLPLYHTLCLLLEDHFFAGNA